MPKRRQIGVLLAAIALSGGAAWAAKPIPQAKDAQRQKSAARFTLTEAKLAALFPVSVSPYRSSANLLCLQDSPR